MIADTSIFTIPELFSCPQQFTFIEDLWLSYFAEHRLGWRLLRSAARFHQIDDSRDQYHDLVNLKSTFLQYLVAQGWHVPRSTLSPVAVREPLAQPCSCAQMPRAGLLPGAGSVSTMPAPYEPERYWSQRLSQEFSIRGVGHISYGQGYNEWLYRRKRIALTHALPKSPPGSRALDVGSGTGWVVKYLLDRKFAVTGCDITQVAVDRLRLSYPTAHFFRLAVGSAPIPLDDACLHLVTAMDVLYHIVDDELWQKAVQEFSRVLRPDGYLIVTDALGRNHLDEAAHVRKRSIDEWESAAMNAGLRIVKVGSLYRWLSRSKDLKGWRRLSDDRRGMIEFRLERAARVTPHMRWAVLAKQ
jgi:SAM-dependent methyltransferase